MIIRYNGKDRVPRDATMVCVEPAVTKIDDRAFFECSSLRTIKVHGNITEIGMYAFYGCTSLKTIEMPPSISEIGACAFYNCSSLQSIDIPQGVEILNSHAFCGCVSLRSVTIPPSVVTISGYAFSACSSLIAVHLPPSVSYIGNGVFQGCSSLSSIAVPPSTRMGLRAFDGCDELEKAVTNEKHLVPWLKQRFSDLPLHDVCYSYNTCNDLEVTCEQIISFIKRNPCSIQAQDELGFTALHLLSCNLKVGPRVMRLLAEARPDLATIKNYNGLSPIHLFLSCRGYSIDEEQGRLPLYNALEQGITVQDFHLLKVLDLLLCLEQWEKHETNNLYPFMMTAGLKECNLDLIYTLTRESVQFIQIQP